MPLTRGLNKPPIRDGILNKELDSKYKVIAEIIQEPWIAT